MPIRLSEAVEARIQRQLERGPYQDASELLDHALDLVEREEDWLVRNREAIKADLDESFAQAPRGEGFSVEEAKAILAERRASRVA